MTTKDDRTVLERFREFVMMEGSAPAVLVEALAELEELDQLFVLRHSADMLAIAHWRQAAPGRELKQPDHTDLCVWLLDELDEREKTLMTWAIHGPQVAWRPIAEAPIPGPDGLPEYWTFPCLLQTASGVVGEGFARYATDNRTKGRKHVRVLRWYLGSNDRPRDSYVCKEPRYFQLLPQPKKD